MVMVICTADYCQPNSLLANGYRFTNLCAESLVSGDRGEERGIVGHCLGDATGLQRRHPETPKGRIDALTQQAHLLATQQHRRGDGALGVDPLAVNWKKTGMSTAVVWG